MVVHGQPVAHADDAELQRRAAGQAHSCHGRLGDLVQVYMAGNQFIVGVGDADEGAVDLRVRQAHGLKK